MRAPAASEKNPGPAARESCCIGQLVMTRPVPPVCVRGHVPPAGLTQPRRAGAIAVSVAIRALPDLCLGIVSERLGG